MVEARKYKKILYPTDFSDKSVFCLKKVLKAPEFADSEFFLLHAFRLIGADAESKNLVAAKRMLEINSINAFNKLNEDFLKQSNQRFNFLSEVGFVSDRVISNISEYDIDLLILCDNMREEIYEKAGKDYQNMLERIPCPMLLMPEYKIIGLNHKRA